MVMGPYSLTFIEKVQEEISQAGYSEYTEDIFAIARWSEDGMVKLEMIIALLSELGTNDVYRTESKGTSGYDYNPTFLYIEKQAPRNKPSLILRRRYKWIPICSTVTQYWHYPLELHCDNLSVREYNILFLIKKIQDKYDVPFVGDFYANQVNWIRARMKRYGSDALLSIPSEEYRQVTERLAGKMGKRFNLQVR